MTIDNGQTVVILSGVLRGHPGKVIGSRPPGWVQVDLVYPEAICGWYRVTDVTPLAGVAAEQQQRRVSGLAHLVEALAYHIADVAGGDDDATELWAGFRADLRVLGVTEWELDQAGLAA